MRALRPVRQTELVRFKQSPYRPSNALKLTPPEGQILVFVAIPCPAILRLRPQDGDNCSSSSEIGSCFLKND
jgi:hypothetical protein